MSKEQLIQEQGKVIEILPDTKYIVELTNGNKITAYLGGKLRMHSIKILVGDAVKVEISPYDLTKGRITWRNKN